MELKSEYIALGILITAVLLCMFLSLRRDVVKHNSGATNVTGLIRASKQWLDASVRDSDVTAALMHVSYAAAYLHAARSMMSDSDILMATGSDVETLVTMLTRQQKSILDRTPRARK